MLLILIPAAWLTVLTVIVAACQMAAHGDRRSEQAHGMVRDALAGWMAPPPALVLNVRRSPQARRPLEDRLPLQARRPARRLRSSRPMAHR